VRDNDSGLEVRARLKGRGKPIEFATVTGGLRGGRLNVPRRYVEFDGAHLVDMDLGGISFDSFRVRESTFERCDFRRFRSSLTLPSLGIQAPIQTVYRECRFEGADLRRAFVGEARFESCVFDGARIERWSSTHAEFIDCHFAGKVVSCNFFGREPGIFPYVRRTPGREERNEFRGNDFSNVELIDTAFVGGIDISAQRWPEGANYIRLDRFHERVARARMSVLSWSSESDRKVGLEMLYVRSHYGYQQQQEVFTRRDAPQTVARELRDRVWDLLEHAL
jgi:uncharacterized protein YjbI with pentapeptide repeats